MAELTNPEKRLLRTLKTKHEDWSLEEILTACEWDDQAIAVSAGHGLSNHGFVKISESSKRDIILGVEGQNALANGLLEERLWEFIQKSNEVTMADISKNFEKHEAGPGIGLLKGLGVSIAGGKISFDDGNFISKTIQSRKEFLQSPDIDNDLVDHFKGRKNLIEIVEVVTRSWKITPEGINIDEDDLQEIVQISEITPELLQTSEWKNAEFRPYDVSLEASIPRTGKSHAGTYRKDKVDIFGDGLLRDRRRLCSNCRMEHGRTIHTSRSPCTRNARHILPRQSKICPNRL